MAETLLALLTAHLVADFVLQFTWLLRNKRRVWVLTLHVLIVTACTALTLGSLHPQILVITFVTHWLADAVKVYWCGDTLRPFVADQLVHLAVVGVLAYVYPHALAEGCWRPMWNAEQAGQVAAASTLLCGLILCVPAGGYLIGKAIERFTVEIAADELTGLPRGGEMIGRLERALVLLLILGDQATGIGFLIAAKSILRFGEIKDASQRRIAEYIIIGTFLSFGWALLIAMLTKRALDHWLA
ncbi:MAG: DUF3307 domain-containing protein [Planctomycetes bacterium]|nr:DUF3307 domain-containing protein [Planctomycetota bacterium]